MDNKELLKALIEGRKEAIKDLIVEEVLNNNDELLIERWKGKIEAYNSVLEDMENYL